MSSRGCEGRLPWAPCWKGLTETSVCLPGPLRVPCAPGYRGRLALGQYHLSGPSLARRLPSGLSPLPGLHSRLHTLPPLHGRAPSPLSVCGRNHHSPCVPMTLPAPSQSIMSKWLYGTMCDVHLPPRVLPWSGDQIHPPRPCVPAPPTSQHLAAPACPALCAWRGKSPSERQGQMEEVERGGGHAGVSWG